MPSLLEDPSLVVLLTKNALRLGDCRRLSEVENDELFDNIMHFALESALYAYMAKERNKFLKWEFGAQEIDRRLLAEEYSRLKTQVDEMEGMMKETMESVDKIQVDRGEADAS